MDALELLHRLRALDADRQVALLFVALFSALGLCSAAIALLLLRRADTGHARHDDRREGLLRDLRALWVGTVVFWLAWVSGAVGATLLFALLSFLALREFITLTPTRRGDHRSLLLAFFAVLPVQYLIVALRGFDLFSVFIPVYVFLAIPVAGALAGDPERFLERNAKIQWGIMVCVFGLSHAPALLLLEFPGLCRARCLPAVLPGHGRCQCTDRAGTDEPLAAPPPGGAAHRPLVLLSRLDGRRAGRRRWSARCWCGSRRSASGRRR